MYGYGESLPELDSASEPSTTTTGNSAETIKFMEELVVDYIHSVVS